MSKSAFLAAATAATFGALSLAAAPSAEAGGYKYGYRSDGVVVFVGSPPYAYDGYRPYRGPYYFVRSGIYQEPEGIFRPAGVVFRPYYAAPSPVYCGRWGYAKYNRWGKPKKWRCLAW